MTHRTTRLPAVAFALLTASAPTAAALQNASFATGLSEWTSIGDVTTPSGTALLTTASTQFEDDFPAPAGAFNASGVPAASVGAPADLETFLGLAPGALDPDIANGMAAYEGSALKQRFFVDAPATLSFSWRLSTNDTTGQDYGFVAMDGVVTLLAISADATLPGSVFAAQTTASNRTLSVESGVHWLAFGVVDVGDYNSTSALTVSAVSLLPVPEPDLWLQMALGLTTLALASIRRGARRSNPLPQPDVQGASHHA